MNFNNRLSSTLANNIKLDSNVEHEAEKIAGGNIIWLVNRPAGVKIYVNSTPDRTGALVLNEANRGYKWEELGEYGSLKLYDNFYIWTEGTNLNNEKIELQISPNADIITPILGNTADKIAGVGSVDNIGSLSNILPNAWSGLYGLSNIKKIYKEYAYAMTQDSFWLNSVTQWGQKDSFNIEIGNRKDMYIFMKFYLSVGLRERNNIQQDFNFNFSAIGNATNGNFIKSLAVNGKVGSLRVTENTSNGDLENVFYPTIIEGTSFIEANDSLFSSATSDKSKNVFNIDLIMNVNSENTQLRGYVVPIAFYFNIEFTILEV